MTNVTDLTPWSWAGYFVYLVEGGGFDGGMMRAWFTLILSLAAAAVVALAGDPSARPAVLKAVSHYDYAKLNMAEFFFAEVAYYALPEAK